MKSRSKKNKYHGHATVAISRSIAMKRNLQKLKKKIFFLKLIHFRMFEMEP